MRVRAANSVSKPKACDLPPQAEGQSPPQRPQEASRQADVPARNLPLFHEVSIGKIALPGNVFLAPVAGWSDRAFRSVCVECGASFAFTEMVSAEALARGNKKTEILMRRAQGEKFYAVQLFGGNPQTMESAARMAVEISGCDAIDINCGCPVHKITKSGAGSALMRDPQKLRDIALAAVRGAGGVPVTVKIRSGWGDGEITWKECAAAALDAGVSAITMHPRTRAQGYEGKADWNALKSLVDFVSSKVPVFGSGDLFSPQDAKSMLETTGCAAVMFARGAMGNPFIFSETKEFLRSGSFPPVDFKTRVDAGLRELDRLVADIGEERACLEMRKRFCAYTKGAEGGAALRAKIVHASTVSEYRALLGCMTREA